MLLLLLMLSCYLPIIIVCEVDWAVNCHNLAPDSAMTLTPWLRDSLHLLLCKEDLWVHRFVIMATEWTLLRIELCNSLSSRLHPVSACFSHRTTLCALQIASTSFTFRLRSFRRLLMLLILYANLILGCKVVRLWLALIFNWQRYVGHNIDRCSIVTRWFHNVTL